MAKEMTEVEKMNAVCFWLINVCREANAETLTVTQKGVMHLGKDVGNWEVTVKKVP